MREIGSDSLKKDYIFDQSLHMLWPIAQWVGAGYPCQRSRVLALHGAQICE